jgi:hypothetical protein
MEEVPILGRDLFRSQIEAGYDGPAYVRRARQVEQAFEDLLNRGRKQRDEWLPMVRLRLALLLALAGDWERVRPLLAHGDRLGELQWLHAELQPRLRGQVEPTSSVGALRRALRELRECIDYFNRRWLAYVPQLDLTRVNQLRDGYNRYYLLEKEIALRSPRLARQGFVRLEPLTTEDVLAKLPPLPVLELKGR